MNLYEIFLVNLSEVIKNPPYNLSVSLTLDSSPGRGALGRPGRPCCSLGPDWAQGGGPCPHWQQHSDCCCESQQRSPVVSGSKNFARPERPSPTRQWSSSLCRYSRHLPPAGGSLSYKGRWHCEAMTERLYQEERDLGRPGAPPSAGTDFMQRSFDMNTAGFVCGGAGNHPFDGRSPALS